MTKIQAERPVAATLSAPGSGSAAAHRLTTLDGIRGIAALSVVLYHFKYKLTSGVVFPSAYLAVDLFFILSGFVISRFYDQQLLDGMGVTSFISRRILRLYPVFLIGILLFLFGYSVATVIGGDRILFQNYDLFFYNLILNTLALPAPSTYGHAHLFKTNFAAWSIFFEIAINIVFAMTFNITRKYLIFIVFFGLILMMLSVSQYGDLNTGVSWNQFAGGACRVIFGFFFGVFLSRVKYKLTKIHWCMSWFIPLIILISFIPNFTGYFRIFYDLIIATIVYPLSIWVGAQTEGGAWEKTLYKWLGTISYPLYIIHVPLLSMCDNLSVWLWHRSLSDGRPFLGMVSVILIVIAATVIASLVDRPIQRWLAVSRGHFPAKPSLG